MSSALTPPLPAAAARGVPVTLTNVTRHYRTGDSNHVLAVDGISLHVPAGQRVALMGPSGSGKSTLLYLIGALDHPDSGTVQVDGSDLGTLTGKQAATYRRSIGFVFQRYNLLPHLTALDNVLTPFLPYRTDFDKVARARELLDAVGLAGRHEALPSRLSGGQQQRIAIARALIGHPGLILADEPTGNLDTTTGREILTLLDSLHRRYGITVLVATHDPDVAATLDRTIHLHDGRITNMVH